MPLYQQFASPASEEVKDEQNEINCSSRLMRVT